MLKIKIKMKRQSQIRVKRNKILVNLIIESKRGNSLFFS
jgi:hypothetical protein